MNESKDYYRDKGSRIRSEPGLEQAKMPQLPVLTKFPSQAHRPACMSGGENRGGAQG
jgi:hypothetical protein